MDKRRNQQELQSHPRPLIDPDIHRRAKWRNRINTWLIMGGLTLLLAVSAWAFFGVTGVMWALGLGAVFFLFTPRISPAMVLRLYKARPIESQEAPELFHVMDVLAKRAELPETPKLYYIASSNMNAFAVGRPEDSAITMTDGLLRGLNLRQLTGVLAHEVSHVANEDLKVMGLADLVGRLTTIMQSIGFFLLFVGLWQGGRALVAAIVLMLAPTVGTFLQLALSRSREYDADLGAVRLTGDPIGLASALQTLEHKQGNLWESVLMPGGRLPNPSVLRTHPKTEDRVARLKELTPGPDPELETTETKVVVPAAFRRVLHPPRYHMSGFWY